MMLGVLQISKLPPSCLLTRKLLQCSVDTNVFIELSRQAKFAGQTGRGVTSNIGLKMGE